MNNNRMNDRFVIDHTRFIFRTNFSGDATQDRFGSTARQCNIVIDPDLADEMAAKGYRVRETTPRQDDDPASFVPEYFVKATVKFKNRMGEPVKTMPTVKLVREGKPPVDIDEDSIGMLDRIRLKDVCCVLNGYPYNDAGDRALSIKTLYVTQDMDDDPFAARYASSSYEEDEGKDLPF